MNNNNPQPKALNSDVMPRYGVSTSRSTILSEAAPETFAWFTHLIHAKAFASHQGARVWDLSTGLMVS